MKLFGKILIFVFLNLFLTTPLFAWSRATHEHLIQESLKEVSKGWGLNRSLTVTSFQSFLEKLAKVRPDIRSRDNFAKWLQINPESFFDRPKNPETIGKITTPYAILSLYAMRPDDGRDTLLPYDKMDQFWFGSGTKMNSQAFRHMEKTPFDPLHPLNTFGFPLGETGQASDRAQIYFDLALLAYRLHEPYWAWNFLGCAFHYIEDLSQPYHSAQLLTPLAFNGINAYFDWGWKTKKGLIKTVTQVAANLHHYFENYVEDLLFSKEPMSQLWNEALRGKDMFATVSSIEALAKEVRNASNRYAYDAVVATLKLSGKNLLGPRAYLVGDEEEGKEAESPSPYFNANGQERSEAASEISKIVVAVFKVEGQAVRTTVQQFLKEAQHVQEEKGREEKAPQEKGKES